MDVRALSDFYKDLIQIIFRNPNRLIEHIFHLEIFTRD